MKKIFILSIISLVLFQANRGFCQAVPPAQVMQYLRSNITIRYIGNPNTNSPAITPITGQTIASNTDGILFGRGGNNYMTQSARLLLSLFKDRSLRPRDGDFQDYVYRLLKLQDKPIVICFFNDQMNSIDPAFINQYGFLDTFRVGSTLHVWPTTLESVGPSTAGTIFIGERVLRGFGTLRQSKLILLNLIASLAIGDFRQMHKFWIFNSGPGAPSRFLYSLSLMDSRQKTNQGICNAMRYALDVAERDSAFHWYDEKTSLVKWSSSPAATGASPAIPPQFWLYDEFNTDGLLNRGTGLTNPPFGPTTVQDYRQIHLTNGGPSTFSAEMDKYTARDEVILGMMNLAFAQFLGLPNFLDALKYDNNRLITAEPERRLAILLENLCLSNLGGRTLQDLRTNPPAQKKYLLGIALFDFLSRYGSGGNATEINRWMLGGSISPELATNYAAVRPQIITATAAAASQGVWAQLEAIKTTLQIP